MEFEPTSIPGVTLIRPRVFSDDRGYFLETYQSRRFAEAGIPETFVQDNHSHSGSRTLRGLHYQLQHPQGKLVRVVRGTAFDVILDIRRGSPTFGRWLSFFLSAENHLMVWIPPGLAHGYLSLADSVDFLYRCTDFYYPKDERTILWNDPDLAIQWPLDSREDPILSPKDAAGTLFRSAEYYP